MAETLIPVTAAMCSNFGRMYGTNIQSLFDGQATSQNTLSLLWGPYPITDGSRTPGGLLVNYGTPVTLRRVDIQNGYWYNYPTSTPDGGTIFGSNDGGVTKVDLYTFDASDNAPLAWNSYTFPNDRAFTSFGVYKTRPVTGQNVPFFAEIRFYEGEPEGSPAAITCGMIPI